MALSFVWPSWWKFYAGCTVGTLLTLYLCLVDAPPEWIDRKRRGRDGEWRTERQLAPLERRGWHVVHDIDRGPRRGNLDHLVVGPPGVFLLETKRLTGEVSIEGGKLVVRRGPDERDAWSPDQPFGTTVKRAAFPLREDLLARTGVRWVQGVVVLWSDFPPGEVKHDGIVYVHGSDLRRWLESQPTELSPQAVAEVAGHLERLKATGFRLSVDGDAQALQTTR